MANNTLRFEFDVDLKPVKRKKRPEPNKEFPLRQRLLLAYQIQELLDQGKAKSLFQVGEWIDTCHSRISQFINLLNLAPAIQEEILLAQNPIIFGVTEFHIRDIAMEVDWQKQAAMWKTLLSIPSQR